MLKPLVKLWTVAMLSLVNRCIENRRPEIFNLTFNGDLYRVRGHEEGNTLESEEFHYEWAISFCSKEGQKYGFDMSTVYQCVKPLAKKLKERRIFDKEGVSESFMTLNVSPVSESVATKDAHSSQEAAQQQIQSETDHHTDNTMQPAAVELEPVANTEENSEVTVTMESAVEQPSTVTPVSPLTHKLPLEINGVTYVFEYIVSDDAVERSSVAQKLAVSFCEMHGASLVDPQQLASIMQNRGINSEEQLTEQDILSSLLRKDCVEPIAGALSANMKYMRDFASEQP